MSSLLERNDGQCDRFQEWLEETSGPPRGLETCESLLTLAPPGLREHAYVCSDCHDAAEDIVAVRNLVREFEAVPAPGPWFAPRVMAVIASQEAEQTRAAATWLAVPRFASRLSWAAAAVLLCTCTWLYVRPAAAPPAQQTASAFASEHLFDPPAVPASHDDVLSSMTEKDQ